MRAACFENHGGPEVLAVRHLPDPSAGPGEVLVRVQAAGVNPIDTKVRQGAVPLAPSPGLGQVCPGYEGAGCVEALGEGATGFNVGDEVWFTGDIRRQGSYGALLAIDARLVAHKPATLTMAEAAAMPLTAVTVWEALFDTMRLLPKEQAPGNAASVLLVVGGAGGVGSMAIQVAKQVAGLTVVATAGRPDSTAWCKELGTQHVLDHTQPLPPQFAKLGLRDLNLNGVREDGCPLRR